MMNLANYISISRIVLSVLMLFTELSSALFFVIFILCGISDFLDGYVARNYGLNSDLGANLDSLADIIFFSCFLIVLFSQLKISYLVGSWIICIVLIKIVSFVIGYVKFHKLPLIHTYLYKITGALLVLFPFMLLFTSSNWILVILCFIATSAALEELIIIISSQKLDLNCKSIFKKSKISY